MLCSIKLSNDETKRRLWLVLMVEVEVYVVVARIGICITRRKTATDSKGDKFH
jgi:hypothetical protein